MVFLLLVDLFSGFVVVGFWVRAGYVVAVVFWLVVWVDCMIVVACFARIVAVLRFGCWFCCCA